ncbi:hypothetical protein EAH75_04250 [Rhodanobacter glycinis]|nr:hypothetical protein EAH75_04250 [Rhodanobacter glycinis]
MIRIPLRCRWLGHCFHVDASYYYGIDQCEHCGREFGCGRFPIARTKVRAVLAARWVVRLAVGVRFFLFHRCEECGQRFGRHDDAIDHLPF